MEGRVTKNQDQGCVVGAGSCGTLVRHFGNKTGWPRAVDLPICAALSEHKDTVS